TSPARTSTAATSAAASAGAATSGAGSEPPGCFRAHGPSCGTAADRHAAHRRPMSPAGDGEPLAFAGADALDAWLSGHPAPHPGLWVKVAKKGTQVASLGAGDVNDVALCHGWITGQRKGLDE